MILTQILLFLVDLFNIHDEANMFTIDTFFYYIDNEKYSHAHRLLYDWEISSKSTSSTLRLWYSLLNFNFTYKLRKKALKFFV